MTVFTFKKKPYVFFIYKHTDGLQLMIVQLATLSLCKSDVCSEKTKHTSNSEF